MIKLDFYYILIIFAIFFSLILLLPLLLYSSNASYHYAYIDYNDNLGLSARCRYNYCELEDFSVISVKSYIDIRK